MEDDGSSQEEDVNVKDNDPHNGNGQGDDSIDSNFDSVSNS